MPDFLTDTPVGPLHRGDTIVYRKRNGDIVNATATNLSSTTRNVVFARSPRGLARCIPIHDITRIERKPCPTRPSSSS